jgi:hypothetical protein
MTRRVLVSAVAAWVMTAALAPSPRAAQEHGPVPPAGVHPDEIFQAATDCMACHNGLVTPTGEDVSIGVQWRASMMANASRDPYWQAAVRRETIDHPSAAAAIENACSICHMPMARTRAAALGEPGRVFANLPSVAAPATLERELAADGVSCTVCHQISEERLGTRESLVGGFVIADPSPEGARTIFGPFEVNQGHTTIMRSGTGARPTEAAHIRESELCATCHTLITNAFDQAGNVVGSLPEQVPYQEWEHSAFPAEEASCQSCHMPAVDGEMRITSVLGEPREGLGRHTFVGGNFLILRMLNRHRDELGVTALPSELDASAAATLRQLGRDTATIDIPRIEHGGAVLEFDVAVANVTGHKLPTAYPSRRSWIHLTVRDGAGSVVFESGRVAPTGAIVGNDNDADPTRYEPHYRRISRPDEVQIYESIVAGPDGAVTTGLLTATQYLKDNRLLPRGFDKATAGPDVAVHGGAEGDADFTGGSDHVQYAVALGEAAGPFTVEAELLYQSIGFRWAWNLNAYEATEPQRFVQYYDGLATDATATLATTRARVP